MLAANSLTGWLQVWVEITFVTNSRSSLCCMEIDHV